MIDVKEIHYTQNHPQKPSTGVYNSQSVVSFCHFSVGSAHRTSSEHQQQAYRSTGPCPPLSLSVAIIDGKICLTYSDSHGLVVAGDMIGNIFSLKMGEVSAVNTDNGDVPPHHVLGGYMKNKRCVQMPYSKSIYVHTSWDDFRGRQFHSKRARLNADMFSTAITSSEPC